MEERAKEIINNLETLGEKLLAFSDDIWLSIEHNDANSFEEGVQLKRSYNEKVKEFELLAIKLSALIRQCGGLQLEEKQPLVTSREENERIIQALDLEQPYDLSEDFCYKRPYGFVIEDKAYKDINTWRSLYELFCKELFQRNEKIFYSLVGDVKFKGRRNNYFANREQDLRVAIPIKEDMFAEGNLSANSIKGLMIKLLAAYNINQDQVKVYLREDRNAD